MALLASKLHNTLIDFWNMLLFKKESKFFAAAFWVTVISMALHVMFMDDVPNDAAFFYARLVREFGAANWERAFFPGIPPLMTVLSGPLALLGIPAFTSLKIVSGALFIFGLWPFRRLMSEVLSDKLVDWACLLYAVSPRLIRTAGSGLLESSKAFLLLWSVVFLIEYARSKKIRWIVALALSTSGLALGRSEGIMFFPFILFWIVFLGLQRRGARSRWSLIPVSDNDEGPASNDNSNPGQHTVPKRGYAISNIRLLMHSIIFVVVFSAVCLPQVVYVYNTTGKPALELRHIQMGKEALKKIRFFPSEPIIEVPSSFKISNSALIQKKITDPPNINTPIRGIKETFKALYPFNVCMGLLGLLLLGFRKQINVYDILFLSVIVYNFMVFFLVCPIVKRYLIPTIPFLLSWTTVGVTFIFTSAFLRKQKILGKVLAALILAGLIWDGTLDLRSSLWDENIPKQVGLWIGENREQFIKPNSVILQTSVSRWIYHNGRQPIIAATAPQYSFWADADICLLYEGFIFSYAQLMDHLRAYKADLLIADENFHGTCPEFKSKLRGNTEFKEVIPSHANWELKIYKLSFSSG